MPLVFTIQEDRQVHKPLMVIISEISIQQTLAKVKLVFWWKVVSQRIQTTSFSLAMVLVRTLV